MRGTRWYYRGENMSDKKDKDSRFQMMIKYLRYVLRLKYYVFIECCNFGIPFRGLLHDMSKFLPSEFMPYARYFYDQRDPRILSDFNTAWLKHQRRNAHHWQWWLLREDDGKFIPIEMPKPIVYEMLADWYGAGKALNGNTHTWRNTWEWFKNNRHLIHLNPYTDIAVRRILMDLSGVPVEDEEILVEQDSE
jgi:hypothetical protein